MKNITLYLLMLIGSTSHAIESKLYRGVDFKSTCAKAASIEKNNGLAFIVFPNNLAPKTERIFHSHNGVDISYTCSPKKWELSVYETYKSDIEATKRIMSLKDEAIYLHGKPTFSPENIGILGKITILFRKEFSDLLYTWHWQLHDRDVSISKKKTSTEWQISYSIRTPTYIIQCNGNICKETTTRS